MSVSSAADKLALVIGVSTYRTHGVPLPAVENDVVATVKAFEMLQFKVVSLLDLTLNEMKDAIKMFCDLLSPDVYGHCYFSISLAIISWPWSSKFINFMVGSF